MSVIVGCSEQQNNILHILHILYALVNVSWKSHWVRAKQAVATTRYSKCTHPQIKPARNISNTTEFENKSTRKVMSIRQLSNERERREQKKNNHRVGHTYPSPPPKKSDPKEATSKKVHQKEEKQRGEKNRHEEHDMPRRKRKKKANQSTFNAWASFPCARYCSSSCSWTQSPKV